MAEISAGLGRRGRPPTVTDLGDNRYSVIVKGGELKFRKTGNALRVSKNGSLQDDVNYGKAVVKKFLGIS